MEGPLVQALIRYRPPRHARAESYDRLTHAQAHKRKRGLVQCATNAGVIKFKRGLCRSSVSMAFCLVKWIEEDNFSVISSSWVLQPDDISTSKLPVDGVCYWRKKSCQHQTRIFSVSGIILVYVLVYILYYSNKVSHSKIS